MRLALDTAPKVAVVLGSSFRARSAKNPFTWEERAAMIGATLNPEERERVMYIPVRDYYDDVRWAAAVHRQVQQHADSVHRIALVGHFKDTSSAYLNLFSPWRLIAAETDLAIDATAIRQTLFEAAHGAAAFDAIGKLVPPAVLQYLETWTRLPHYSMLAQEHAQLSAYKAAWKSSPYPPIFSTVDAVVLAAGHVLLIQRGDFPGKGLWALPGGFLEQHERLLQGALRELREETGLTVPASSLEEALVDVRVFDHPDRSQRGRTITHVHFFNLNMQHLPDIEAADDAAQARWIPIETLTEMEEIFFEDHFHILDSFLGLIPQT